MLLRGGKFLSLPPSVELRSHKNRPKAHSVKTATDTTKVFTSLWFLFIFVYILSLYNQKLLQDSDQNKEVHYCYYERLLCLLDNISEQNNTMKTKEYTTTHQVGWYRVVENCKAQLDYKTVSQSFV